MTDFLPSLAIQDENNFWLVLSSWLRCKIRRWAYAASIARWCVQEEEVIDDIVGEAVARTFERLKLAEKDKVEPIVPITQSSQIIAHNDFINLTRRGPKVFYFSQFTNDQKEETVAEHHRTNLVPIAIKVVFNESFVNFLTKEIGLFPSLFEKSQP